MLSKAVIKFVKSLEDKKHRSEHHLFVVEGNKNVAELLRSKIEVKSLFTTNDWLISEQENIHHSTEVTITDKEGIRKLSFLQSPQDALALAVIPERHTTLPNLANQFVLVLDTIQDPGNLGALIRIADWYGITRIICSPGCADAFSPKVIQASMGSFLRIEIYESPLQELFETNPAIPVYGAVLNGKNLYTEVLSDGILLIGNEGHGIHPDLLKFITHPVTIPKKGNAESLNAAIAAAIICDARARNSS